jgi:hypothetical protein
MNSMKFVPQSVRQRLFGLSAPFRTLTPLLLPPTQTITVRVSAKKHLHSVVFGLPFFLKFSAIHLLFSDFPALKQGMRIECY